MSKKMNINAILSQFKGLDQSDPSSWPKAPKAAFMGFTFVAVMAAGYSLDWSAQFEELEMGQQQEVALKDEYVSKYRQAVNLDLYKKQLQEANVRLASMLRQLPNRSQMDALITDINSAGINRGLQFELFRPAQTETKTDVYAELPISIKVTGSYHDMGRFVSDIGQLPRIVTLNDIILSTPAQGTPSSVMTMEAVAKTFRYLDEEEVAAAKAPKNKAAPAHAGAAERSEK